MMAKAIVSISMIRCDQQRDDLRLYVFKRQRSRQLFIYIIRDANFDEMKEIRSQWFETTKRLRPGNLRSSDRWILFHVKRGISARLALSLFPSRDLDFGCKCKVMRIGYGRIIQAAFILLLDNDTSILALFCM